MLTNQPCEFTVTAVGEVKVLVLHDARWHLAAYRDPAKFRAARRARKGPKGPGSHKHPVAGRKVKDPSRATQLLQLTRLHGWLPRQRIYLLDPQGNCFSVAVPATVAPGGIFKVRAPIRAPYGGAWAARAHRTRRARGAHAPVARAWHSLEVIGEECVPTCLLGGAEGGGGVEGAGAGASSPAGGAGGGGRQRGTRFIYFDRPQDLLRSMVLRLPRDWMLRGRKGHTGRVASTKGVLA